jgi:hypothetical protein
MIIFYSYARLWTSPVETALSNKKRKQLISSNILENLKFKGNGDKFHYADLSYSSYMPPPHCASGA